MGRDAFRFLRGIGLKIKVLYAATETGVIAVHRDELDPGTVGKPLPGVAISPEGEVIIDKRHCFSGYYKDTEATEKAFRDGYFHTGDAGYINENGHLVFWDRMSDIKQLRTGAKFAPQYIETRLRFSPYIEDAFAVGGQERDFVGALITINLNSVGNWLEKRNIPYTTFADASQKLEVRELIRQEIQKMNRTLPDGSGVKKFIDLYKQLDADEAELTRTQKLRRDFMEKHYAELIDILYGDGSTRTVEAPIVYRDGRSGVLKITLNVNPVDLSEEGSL